MRQEQEPELGVGLGIVVALGIALGILFTGSGCASTHPGQMAQAETSNGKIPLKVSAELAHDPTQESYALVYLTFENVGDKWVRVAESNVDIPPSRAGQVSVVVGKDLEDWASAVETTEKLTKYNKSILETALLVAGAAAVIVTHNRTSAAEKVVSDLGIATIAGTGAYMVGSSVSGARNRAEQPVWVPSNHLYAPFAVPARLFLRRWVLLNKPVGMEIHSLKFEIKTAEGEVEKYEVAL